MPEWEDMTTRERDATVITQVLGWPIFPSYHAFTHRDADSFPCAVWGFDRVAGIDRYHLFEEDDDFSDPLSPSTRIQDAWLVVEHLATKGHHTTIWITALDQGKVEYICRVDGVCEDEQVSGGTTAAEAICLAALARMPHQVRCQKEEHGSP